MKAVVITADDMYGPGYRLDASYYASDGARAWRFIRQWAGLPSRTSTPTTTQEVQEKLLVYSSRRVDTLAEVCLSDGIFIPSRFKRTYVSDPKYGTPYLTGSSIMLADPLNGTKYLSSRSASNRDNLALSEQMILVTCSGIIGNSAYVHGGLTKAVGSPDLLRVVANPSKIHPGYLYAFLSSVLGRALIEQKTYSATIPHIEVHHVIDLPVPRLEPSIEKQIHELIEQASSRRVEAQSLLNQAQTRLFEITKIPRLTYREALTKGGLTFTVPSSQYGEFTLDAWRYSPITQMAISRIQAGQHAKLETLVEPNGIFYGHRFKRRDANPSAGIMLLSQAKVFQARPQGRWISKKLVSDYREYMVPDGVILVAGHGTTGDNELFGRCQFSRHNFNKSVITEDILRLFPNPHKINPGYLYAFLSSEYGFNLFRSTACGSKLLSFVLGLVERIPVPLVSREQQDEIGDMVYQAYDNRADALMLEDKAQALLAEALGLKADL